MEQNELSGGSVTGEADSGKKGKRIFSLICHILGLVVLLAGPAVSYGVFEWITGNLMEIQGIYLVINLLFFYALYLMLAGVTNSPRIVYPVLNTVLTVLALAEYFVVEFRSRPIMVWDMMAFRTALTVSGNYTYEITSRLAAGIGVSLASSLLAIIFSVRMRTKKAWLAGAIVSVAAFMGWQSAFFHVLVPKYNIDISMWDPAETYGYTGYMLCTMRSLQYLMIDPPKGYSPQLIKELGEELEEKKQGELLWNVDTDIVPENLI